MKHSALLKVFAAILLAVIAGLLTGPTASIFGVTYVQIFGLIGQLFLNALMLVVVPLVASSIISGTARMGAEEAMASLGKKTFGFFFLNLVSAVLLGLFLALLFSPGVGQVESASQVSQANHLTLLQQQGQEGSFQKIEQILYKLIPPNILAAASQGQMLGLIAFSLVFGFYISKIEEHPASILLGFWKGIFQIMMKVTHLIMKALPFGVFGLVAKVVATLGWESIRSVGLFSFVAFLGLALHTLVTLPLFLKGIGKVNPVAHFKAMGSALLTGFSTSSSAATLPVTLECLEKKVGVSNRICGFAVPLGTSLNSAGSAVYVCIGAIFIAQVYGVALTIPVLATIVVMTLLASLGTAGIPSSCLIALMVVLNAIGIPPEGIGLVLATERILDMCRTVVNIFGNSCCAVLIARADGEKDILVSPVQSIG